MIIESLIRKPQQPQPWPGYWRISSIGRCQRSLLAEALGFPALQPDPALVEEGNLHELDLINRLKAQGYKLIATGEDQVQVQLKAFGTDWPVYGHPDGLLIFNGTVYLLELKYKDFFTFSRLQKTRNVREAFPVEYAQVQGYLHSSGLPEQPVACLYIAKSSRGQLYEEVIRPDGEYLDWLLHDHIAPVLAAYTRGATRPTELSCHSNEYVRRFCPHRHLCENRKVSSSGTKSLETEENISSDLKMAADQWREGQSLLKKGKELVENAKAVFNSFMIKNNAPALLIDGLNVRLVKGQKETIMLSALKELVPEEVLSRVIKRTEYEYLRIGSEEPKPRGERWET